jgi:hypothetical protein
MSARWRAIRLPSAWDVMVALRRREAVAVVDQFAGHDRRHRARRTAGRLRCSRQTFANHPGVTDERKLDKFVTLGGRRFLQANQSSDL